MPTPTAREARATRIKSPRAIYEAIDESMLRTLLTCGVLLYAACILWIIVPSGPMPCESVYPAELAQQNITIGAWQAQFISERFCQCYESENGFLRTLPFLAAACMVAVLLLLDQLDTDFRNEIKRQTDKTNYDILCYTCRLHKLPKPMRHVLIAIAVVSYCLLTFFTARQTHGFMKSHDPTAHYFFTSLFFVSFTLLYANAVWDFSFLTEKKTWVSWFHTVALTGMLVMSWVFAIFALVIRDTLAILMEYILFGWILFAVPLWLLFMSKPSTYFQSKAPYTRMQEASSKSSFKLRSTQMPDSTAMLPAVHEMSIYDLNLDILSTC